MNLSDSDEPFGNSKIYCVNLLLLKVLMNLSDSDEPFGF